MTEKPADLSSLADQAEHWVVRLASGAITPREMADFETWLARSPHHRAAFDRQRGLWQSLEGHEAAFASAPPSLRRRSPRRSWGGSWARRHPAWTGMGAVAASLALVLAVPDAMVRLRADAIADTGQVRTLALPDGSRAMLDSGAAVAVRFNATERRIELLRGAAWFDVKHGDARPFRVAALDGVTEDIGTAFEVSQRDDTVNVGVTEGVVRVSSPKGANSVTVRQFGRVRYRQGGPVRGMEPGTATGIAAWRRGIIVIDNLPVASAIAEVARYRSGVTWTLADTSGSAPVSGVFRTDAPDEALQTLASMAGLRLTTFPAGVAILRR
jgi:transmembrane sensor